MTNSLSLICFIVIACVKQPFQARFGLASLKTILMVRKLKCKNAVWQGGKQGFLTKNTWVIALLELSANYKRGTGARGQLQAPEELWGEGTSRSQIITASISYDKLFMWGKQSWQFGSSWSAQWNKTPLIPQDRFSIGGRYTVPWF